MEHTRFIPLTRLYNGLSRMISGAFAWDGGQGPWGRSQPPAGRKKPQPTDSANGNTRRSHGPSAQPDLEDVMNAFAEKLRGRVPGFGGGQGRNDGFLFQLLLVIIGVVWLLSGFYIVAPDEQGVVTRFGKYVQTSDSGLNYHLPWPVESVTILPVTRENVIEIGFRSGRSGLPSSDIPEESMMLTGDENIVDLDFTVRWRISNPANYLFNVANPENGVVAVAESVMRETIGRHPIDDALTDNKLRIQQEARQHMQALLDYYRSGVQVTGVELQQVNPPSEVIAAFRDVQAARADAEKTINEAQGYANQILPQARGQAAQVLQAAEAYRTATVANAQGDAARFNAQVGAYKANPGVVRDRLYLESMEQVLKDANKVVVTGRSGNLLPFLPLDRLSPAQPATTGNATNTETVR